MFAATRSLIALPYSTHAVLDPRLVAGRSASQVDIQRHHAALDVQVLDDDAVAFDLDQRGRVARSSASSSRKARQREGDVRVFERIGHAAHAVVVLHQQVFSLIWARVVSFGGG
jgi:hypothetical protein